MIYLGEGFAEGCGGRERLRALARKEKKIAFCRNWEIKRNWGSGSTVNPSLVSVGEQGSKSFKNLQYLRIFM